MIIRKDLKINNLMFQSCDGKLSNCKFNKFPKNISICDNYFSIIIKIYSQ